ncbi:hypothetical protein FIU87_18085 [Bacillus sp. THAF10]|uniref:LPXTG cell wall anchor domain-containing protein n=1 Tax=Bacillus sp. THAF10 TaxID=2587848 RepID=UPI001267ABB4|nr:LPXTG cell wall anchor domain-containing protein [Bacillus sp. THAF10]QFT90557.1 hypothetical protein FIU87_18085 [Bacillus sp. THAF10]
MKFIKLYLMTILCLGALSAVYLPVYQTEATPTSEIIRISTSPSNSFITFSNMAPGDRTTKPLRIMNNGNVDFNYIASAILEKGDQELFDSLLMTITDQTSTLYKGKIHDLQQLSLGSLLSHKDKELFFSVELPREAGNEVKHKSATVEFSFTAIGLTEVNENGNGVQLPNTASNLYNNILLGTILVIFGLITIFIFRRRKVVDN